MKRIATLLLTVFLIPVPAKANHEPQVDGPVTFDLRDAAAFGEQVIQIFNIRTSQGEVIALDIEFTGGVFQAGPLDPFVNRGPLDSHFLFNIAGDNLTVESAFEDANNMRADFSGFAPFQSRDVAQWVTDIGFGGGGQYIASARVRFPDGSIGVFNGSDESVPFFIPEPSTWALLLLGGGFMVMARIPRGQPSRIKY